MPAAERPIIDHPVLVGRELANVMHVNFDDAGKFRSANYSKIKDLSKKLRENCKNVYAHGLWFSVFGLRFLRRPKTKVQRPPF